jgi:hypothetical protein
VPATRPQPVEAQPAGDDDQPPAHVVDLVAVGADQAGVGLLHDVLGFTEVAEHPEPDVEQVTSVATPGMVELDVHVDGLGCRTAVHVVAPRIVWRWVVCLPLKDEPCDRSVTLAAVSHSPPAGRPWR